MSYRVFFFTLYSLGLRLGEGLGLTVADIDAARRRLHIRAGKGNKDRFVPLPDRTLELLRRFWRIHRNPVLRFSIARADSRPRPWRLRRSIAAVCRLPCARSLRGAGLKKTTPHSLRHKPGCRIMPSHPASTVWRLGCGATRVGTRKDRKACPRGYSLSRRLDG
ncbi:tyrosine-type recombinase/integrase [Thiorhodococcus minor]|uniref:tyrosine-type recombinase/integrase n=1 Tax=Thiorhodococcus minor TaxID=57489 RepID=UPI003CC913AC